MVATVGAGSRESDAEGVRGAEGLPLGAALPVGATTVAVGIAELTAVAEELRVPLFTADGVGKTLVTEDTVEVPLGAVKLLAKAPTVPFALPVPAASLAVGGDDIVNARDAEGLLDADVAEVGVEGTDGVDGAVDSAVVEACVEEEGLPLLLSLPRGDVVSRALLEDEEDERGEALPTGLRLSEGDGKGLPDVERVLCGGRVPRGESEAGALPVGPIAEAEGGALSAGVSVVTTLTDSAPVSVESGVAERVATADAEADGDALSVAVSRPPVAETPGLKEAPEEEAAADGNGRVEDDEKGLPTAEGDTTAEAKPLTEGVTEPVTTPLALSTSELKAVAEVAGEAEGSPVPAEVSEAIPDGAGEKVLAEEPESTAAVTVGIGTVAVATTVGGNLLAVGLGVVVGAAGVAVPADGEGSWVGDPVGNGEGESLPLAALLLLLAALAVPEVLIAEVLVAKGESDGRGVTVGAAPVGLSVPVADSLSTPEEVLLGEAVKEPPEKEALGANDDEPSAVEEALCEKAPVMDAGALAEKKGVVEGSADKEADAVETPVPDAELVAAPEPFDEALRTGVAEERADTAALPVPNNVALSLPEESALRLPCSLGVARGDGVSAFPLLEGNAEEGAEGLPVALTVSTAALAVAAFCSDADANTLFVPSTLNEGRALPHALPLPAAPLCVLSAVRDSETVLRLLVEPPTDEPVGDPELHPLTLCERDAEAVPLCDSVLAGDRVLLPLVDTEGEARIEGEVLPLRLGDAEAEGQDVPLGVSWGDAEALLLNETCNETVGGADAAAVADAQPDSENAPVAEGAPDADAAFPEKDAKAEKEAQVDILGEALPEPLREGESSALLEGGALPLAEGHGVPLREPLPLPEGVCEAHCVGAAPEALPPALLLTPLVLDVLADAEALLQTVVEPEAHAVGAPPDALSREEGVPVPHHEVSGVRDVAGEGDSPPVAVEDRVAGPDGDAAPLLESRRELDEAKLPEGLREAVAESETGGVALLETVTQWDALGEPLPSLLSVDCAVSEGGGGDAV